MSSQRGKTIIVALFTTLLAITLLSKMTFFVKGMEFQAGVHLANSGQTEIQIPPVGSITARTHLAPLKIVVRLENIDLDLLQQLLKEAPTPVILAEQIGQDLRDIARRYLLRLLLLGMAGGITGALMVSGRIRKQALCGAATGLCITLLLVGLTMGTYRAEKLRSPEFQGALEAAPWAIGLAENAFKKIDVLSEQMQVITANLSNIFKSIDNIQAFKQDKPDLLVLHVSDIHNNPVAHEFLAQIARSFPIDMIIDTGDLTDYGTPLEGELLKGFADLQIPYVFVPGNHDSPEIIKELSDYPQVRVLIGGTVEIKDLRVLAQADPAADAHEIKTPGPDAMEKSRDELARLWEEAPVKPHLAAVHNYAAAEALVGKIPLVLHGHNHQWSVKEDQGTVTIGAGTTGAAGLRALQAAKEIPYSVVLLHFKKDSHNELYLAAADTIRLYNMERGFTLERKLFPGDGNDKNMQNGAGQSIAKGVLP